MATSEVINSASVSVSVLWLVFVKFNVYFRYYFFALTIAFSDAMDPISLMSCTGERVTSKGGFCMELSPAKPFPSIVIVWEGDMFGEDCHILSVEFILAYF